MSLQQQSLSKKPEPSALMLPWMLRPCALQLSREQRLPMSKLSKKPRPPMPVPSRRLKLLALQPLGMLKLRAPLRLNHSTGIMAKPSETWRNKSFKRKAEAKLTSSLPVRLPYTPAQWSSQACWWPLITFCWGRHPCPTHSPFCKEPPKQSNSLPQWLLLCQCPSSLLGSKGGILPQTMWTACLWVEPHPGNLGRAPSSKWQDVLPWNKVLKQSHSEAFSWDTDLVKEARKECFSKHSYNFTMEGTHNLLEVFKQMAKSTLVTRHLHPQDPGGMDGTR